VTRAVARVTRTPLLAAGLYASLLFPPEFSVSLGTLRLSSYRLVLLFAMPVLLVKLFSGRPTRPHAVDYLMIAHAFWAMLALIVYAGPVDGIESGGILVIESLGAYLVARMSITNADQFRAIVNFMVTLLSALLIFAAYESLTGHHLMRDVARGIMGGPGLVPIDPRMGLDRAYGPFDHPILYGVFAASTFAAVYYVLGDERLGMSTIGRLAIVFLSTFFSLSAGPFLGLATQIGLITWDRLLRNVNYRWVGLLSLVFLFLFAISLGSNRSPVKVLIGYLAFSAESSYNRINIWTYGTAEVARHPIFGIGLGDWIRAPWMSDSMDNFWLITAVRYGLPALIFLVLAIVIMGVTQARNTRGNPLLERNRMAWIVIIVGMSLTGATTHFYNALFSYFFFLVGLGAWLMSPQPNSKRRARWVVLGQQQPLGST
jgi:hypothetical protein